MYSIWDVFWACVVTGAGINLAWMVPRLWQLVKARPVSANVEEVQCCTPIYGMSGSAPERCAYREGHEGKCEP